LAVLDKAACKVQGDPQVEPQGQVVVPVTVTRMMLAVGVAQTGKGPMNRKTINTTPANKRNSQLTARTVCGIFMKNSLVVLLQMMIESTTQQSHCSVSDREVHYN
jgi:hypothetical protein